MNHKPHFPWNTLQSRSSRPQETQEHISEHSC